MGKPEDSKEIAISDNTVVVASANQVSTEVGDDVAILNLDSGVYYGLTEVGASIWGLITVPKTVRQLQQDVCAEYDVHPDKCSEDLHNFIARLADAGLVEIREGDPSQVC